MLKRIILLLITMICSVGYAEEVPERYLEVVVNRYEPADWNHGYGHYDFSVRVTPEYADDYEGAGLLTIEADGVQYSGEELTFYYGPEDGDNSAGMVTVYYEEKPHEAAEELVIIDNLTDSDFVSFMDLFVADFAEFASSTEGALNFHVMDMEFDVYSVGEYKNCAKALERLIGIFPGGMGNMMRKYPDKYNEFLRISNQTIRISRKICHFG